MKPLAAGDEAIEVLSNPLNEVNQRRAAAAMAQIDKNVSAAQRRAEDQILDLHLALRLFVTALNDRARRAALVGVFQLLADAVLRIAEIKLGADAGVA